MKTTNSIQYVLAPVIAMLAAGCTISDSQPPPLAGPSEMSLSLALSANPDVLSQDGGSQSVITIDARDHNGQPVANTLLRLEIEGGDFGSLSARSVVTNSTGRASFTYTAPPGSPTDAGSDVRIRVTPSGTDASASIARIVEIRLNPTGGPIPTGAPNPVFTFLPSSPAAFDVVRFDATGSTAARGTTIVQYVWDFGDGTGGTGAATTHAYTLPGVYAIRLTVTDSAGVSATSTTQTVTVGASTAPTAVFIFSPANPNALQSVFFNASQSTAAPGRRIVSYRWSFGDGSTASGANRTRVYAEPAVYVVVLTVTDDVGQVDTATASVTVCPVGGCEDEEP